MRRNVLRSIGFMVGSHVGWTQGWPIGRLFSGEPLSGTVDSGYGHVGWQSRGCLDVITALHGGPLHPRYVRTAGSFSDDRGLSAQRAGRPHTRNRVAAGRS